MSYRTAPRYRRAFKLVELSAVIAIIVIMLVLMLPAVNAAREVALRNQCLNNMRQLGLACAKYESVRHHLPTISTSQSNFVLPLELGSVPGCVSDRTASGSGGGRATSSAGYSWIVQVLPYCEQAPLYERIEKASSGFTYDAFDPRLADGKQHFSAISIPLLRCPKYSGESHSSLREFYLQSAPAVGNYAGFIGTNVDSETRAVVDNGALRPATVSQQAGLRLAEIRDGLSDTLLAAESRERGFGSWYDGQCAWVVGMQAGLSAGDIAPLQDRYLGPRAGKLHALNFGPRSASYKQNAYIQKFVKRPPLARAWGPSSEHPGGMVAHLFVDQHTAPIRENIDAHLYYRLITRDGGEPVKLAEP